MPIPPVPPRLLVAKPAEDLGYPRYDFLVRDQRAHADSAPDGTLTQDELRRAIQLDIAAYVSTQDAYVKMRADKSRKILTTMLENNIDAVDYLPKNIRDVASHLRPRAAELLAISQEIASFKIDQAVIDYARQRYEGLLARGGITRQSRDTAIAEIDAIVAHLRAGGEPVV